MLVWVYTPMYLSKKANNKKPHLKLRHPNCHRSQNFCLPFLFFFLFLLFFISYLIEATKQNGSYFIHVCKIQKYQELALLAMCLPQVCGLCFSNLCLCSCEIMCLPVTHQVGFKQNHNRIFNSLSCENVLYILNTNLEALLVT